VAAVLETREHPTEALLEPTPAEVQARQRAEFGGLDWAAAFFGWLVATGIGALLTGLLTALGAAIALTEVQPAKIVAGDAGGSDAVGVAGGFALVMIALVSYLTGGYVAGRMSRFDGARQGVAVWGLALVVAAGLALAGVIAGGEYNVLGELDLPRIPVEEGSVTGAGAIVLAAIAVATLVAAVAGGKWGERYHRAVDRVGFRA
jgi:hypothetical protein